jgi:hypothetical protein
MPARISVCEVGASRRDAAWAAWVLGAIALAPSPASAQGAAAASAAAAPQAPPSSDPGTVAVEDTDLARVGTPTSRPPPLNVEYLQYGVALAAELNASPGASCPEGPDVKPCIVGSGGGLAIRGGWRSPGPWYFGGAYQFIKMDSGNLYRLGIFQQLRAEMRYLFDLGYRTQPYVSWGLGAVAYGSEWGVETGGGLAFLGGGVEIEVSRVAAIGFGIVYRPVLLAGWTDTAGQSRDAGIAQFVALEFLLELRTELGRR